MAGGATFPFPVTELHPSGVAGGLGELFDDGENEYRLIQYTSGTVIQPRRVIEWDTRGTSLGGLSESGDVLIAGLVPSGVATTTAVSGDRGFVITKGPAELDILSGSSAIAAGDAVNPQASGRGQPVASGGTAFDQGHIQAIDSFASGASGAQISVQVQLI